MRIVLCVQVIFLFSVFIGCVSSDKRQEPVQLNSEKVLSYTFELEKLKHLDAPYFAKFSKGNKTLLFVASKHISVVKYPNLLEHPTLKTISKLFDEYKPGVVIVEGIDTGTELSPKSIIEFADKCKVSDYKKGCGESFFAINTAREAGRDYITGEPRDAAIAQGLKKFGYTEEDLLGFYMVRQIPQIKRQEQFNAKNFDQTLENQLSRFRRKLNFTGKFGPEEFKTWYSKHMTQPKNYLDIENDDPAPHGGKDATYVQKISNRVTWLRDATTVETIESMLNRFDVVLIIYGGSHLITQEPALIEGLGQPEYFKLF